MSEHDGDRQHPASPIRLQQVRQDGDAARSQELAIALQLLLGVAVLYLLVQGLIDNFARLASVCWTFRPPSDGSFTGHLNDVLWENLGPLLNVILPLLAILFLIAIASHAAQSGAACLFARPTLQPRNLHPAQGLARLLSLKNLGRGLLGFPKVAIVAIATLAWTWHQRVSIARLQVTSVDELPQRMTDGLFAVALSTAVALLLLSILDYVMERFSFFRRHQMTEQQLRDENRMQGPDPQLSRKREAFYQR